MSNGNWEKKQQQLAAILSGVMRDHGWQAQLELHSLFLRWDHLVEGDFARYARPLKIVKGVLWVEAENSAWLQQLQYQKVQLLDQLNGALGNQRLKGIRFVLPQGEERKEELPRVRFVAPPREEVRHFEEQAAFIEDQAARDALVRLWYLSQACVRGDEEIDPGKKDLTPS